MPMPPNPDASTKTTAALARELGWTCKESGRWEHGQLYARNDGDAWSLWRRGEPWSSYLGAHDTLRAAMLAGEKER